MTNPGAEVLTIAEFDVNIGNVSNWGCPGSKCIKQEKFDCDDINFVPETLYEYGIYDAIKQLLEDINEIFAKTGFPTYPSIFISWIPLIIGYIYYETIGVPKSDVVVFTILISCSPLVALLLLFGIAFLFHTERNNQINDALNIFNGGSTAFGIHVEWNEDYANYSKSRLTRFYGSSNYNPQFSYKSPKLLLKMNIPVREKYCRENGLPFQVPLLPCSTNV